MLFKEIIAVYSENHTEPTNITWETYFTLHRLVHIATIRLYGVNLAYSLLLRRDINFWDG
jgi:hypothetical protein